MIIGCISAYNDEEFIGAAIDSIRNIADWIIVVDGAYQGFPIEGGSGSSTDATVGIARSMGVEVVETDRVWKSQEEKRNRYLIGGIGEWYLIIDSDERFVGDLNFNPHIPGYRINCQLRSGKFIPLPRLIKHQDGLRYDLAHDLLWIGDRVLRSGSFPVLNGCHIEHDRDLRSAKRVKQREEYYAYQYRRERGARLRLAGEL